MKKRILSWVLALVMIISLLPVTAFAATTYQLKLMQGTDYALTVTASTDGSATYTKNIEVAHKDSKGIEFYGWAQEVVGYRRSNRYLEYKVLL